MIRRYAHILCAILILAPIFRTAMAQEAGGPRSVGASREEARALVEHWLPAVEKDHRPVPVISRLFRQCALEAMGHTYAMGTVMAEQIDILDQALADLRRALAQDPGLDQARLALGGALALTGRLPEGIAELERTLESLASGSRLEDRILEAECRSRLAWAYRDHGDWDKGLAVLRGDDSAGAGPTSPLIEGLLLGGSGRTSQAISHALRMDPIQFPHQTAGSSGLYPTPSGYANNWIKSQALLSAGNASAARSALGDLEFYRNRNYMPLAERYWQDLGLIEEVLGDRDAIADYKLMAGNLRLAMFHTPSALLAPPEILGFPAQDVPAFLFPGGAYAGGSPFAYLVWRLSELEGRSTAGVTDDAYIRGMDLCETLLRRNILPDVVRAFRGRFFAAVGRKSAAYDDLAAARDGFRAQDLIDGGTWARLANLELVRGRSAEGLALLTEAVDAEPRNAFVWRSYGVALSKAGRADEARLALDRALELQPEGMADWYNRGVLHYRQGEYDEALACLEKAWGLAPGNDRVRFMLQTVSNARRTRQQAPTAAGDSVTTTH